MAAPSEVLRVPIDQAVLHSLLRRRVELQHVACLAVSGSCGLIRFSQEGLNETVVGMLDGGRKFLRRVILDFEYYSQGAPVVLGEVGQSIYYHPGEIYYHQALTQHLEGTDEELMRIGQEMAERAGGIDLIEPDPALVDELFDAYEPLETAYFRTSREVRLNRTPKFYLRKAT